MYRDRVKLYEELEKEFETKLLVYVTGDRVGAPIRIAMDAVDGIVRHLDCIRGAAGLKGDERIEKLSLFLYTPGGDIHAALTILNLLKTYCNRLQVIIPRKAQSAGTFICIGADELVMTKQATLGPVDPSVTTPFNPRGTSDPAPQPVSVEAVEGYFDYAKEKLGVKKEDRVPTEVFLKLSDLISPLTLGDLYRLKNSVREITAGLLRKKIKDEAVIGSIVNYLCGETGSHNYTINRYEAAKRGIAIKDPTQAQYETIEAVYTDISDELSLNQPHYITLDPEVETVKQGLIESVAGGSDCFCSKLVRQAVNGPGELLNVQQMTSSAGWKRG